MLKMKKIIIASLVATTFCASSVMAQPTEVEFVGNVSKATCSLSPVVGGATKTQIDLGTVERGSRGTEIDFTLKPTANAAGCNLNSSNTVTISWDADLDVGGLKNTSGTANGAIMTLVAQNVTASSTGAITKGNTTNEFDLDRKGTADAAIPAAGLAYKAKLDATNATEGTFRTVARYEASYN